MAANCSALTFVGDITNLEAPFSPVGPENSTSGPFGPFKREVQLTHPIDITVPVVGRLGPFEAQVIQRVPDGSYGLQLLDFESGSRRGLKKLASAIDVVEAYLARKSAPAEAAASRRGRQ